MIRNSIIKSWITNSSFQHSIVSLRFFSTSSPIANEKNENLKPQVQQSDDHNNKALFKKPLTPKQKEFLEKLIRVDQAGELGADLIYNGQYTILSHQSKHLKDLLRHMWDQEIHHRATFNDLQTRYRVRPSLLTPFWKVGAFGLGVGTALISKEAAMACTVAVETVIGGHYNDQLRTLMQEFDPNSEEFKYLKEIVGEFRDQELEHLDTALDNDAEKAVPYWLLSLGIKGIVKGAIITAETI